VSSLTLSPYELKKLVICQVAALARRLRERGLKLKLPRVDLADR
jgi:urease gamma subunit